MIDYSEDSMIDVLIRMKGYVCKRACMYAVPSSIACGLLVMLDDFYPELRGMSRLDGMDKSQIWSASTVILVLLLGFRTNRAMARFWEGTGLLHQMRGEWFDATSCLVAFSSAAMDEQPERVQDFRHTLVRLMSVLHGSALAEIAEVASDSVETLDAGGLSTETLFCLKEATDDGFNRVELLLHLIQRLVFSSHDEGVLPVAPPILSRVYQTLSRGFVNLLNCKKIHDTRFPFPYVQLITLLLLFNCILIPLMISEAMSSYIFAPMFTFVIVFGLFSLNFIGVELEDPFGDDDNDLPLGQFQHEMNKSLLMFVGPNADLVPTVNHRRCVQDFGVLMHRYRERVGMSYRLSLLSNSVKASVSECTMGYVFKDVLGIEDCNKGQQVVRQNSMTSSTDETHERCTSSNDEGLSHGENEDVPSDSTVGSISKSLDSPEAPFTDDAAARWQHDASALGTSAASAKHNGSSAPQVAMLAMADGVSRSLEQWARVIESQFTDMSENIATLKALSADLEVALASNAPSLSREALHAEEDTQMVGKRADLQYVSLPVSHRSSKRETDHTSTEVDL